MKKLILLLAILSTGFVSCKKDSISCPGGTKTLALENATVISAGNLSFLSKTNSGLVKVYLQKNGKYLLGLEKMNFNPGVSSNIYFSPLKTVSPQAIKIFSVNSLYGDVFHVLPPDMDFAFFRFLIIQTELTEEILASAELN